MQGGIAPAEKLRRHDKSGSRPFAESAFSILSSDFLSGYAGRRFFRRLPEIYAYSSAAAVQPSLRDGYSPSAKFQMLSSHFSLPKARPASASIVL